MRKNEEPVRLKDKKTEKIIAIVPRGFAGTVLDCLEYLGVSVSDFKDGRRMVYIRGELYDVDNLVLEKRGMGYDAFCEIVDAARTWRNGNAFVSAFALQLDILPPEFTEDDLEFLEQLRALLDVRQTPFDQLIEKFGLTVDEVCDKYLVPEDDMNKWLIDGPPTYIRLMLGEAIAKLHIWDYI